MAKFSRFHKIALVSLGAVGGGFAYYHLNSDRNVKKVHLLTPMKEFSSSMKWDSNWDCREPENLVRPLKNNSAEEENRVNQDLENARPKATRHLFLIRHGQYHIDGATDKERTLTELGRKQAELTGKRLAALDIKWDLLVRSTMTRAQETAAIIAKHLPCDIVIKDCQMLEEGAPIPPEPAVGHWKPEAKFFQDSARIEAAFRKYFHRAPPEQLENSYTVLVCHANVIRYFVCKSDIEYQQRKRSAASECDTSSSDEEHTKKTTSKAKPKSSRSEPKKKRGRKAKSTRALQFPPEGWLRISLNHGSITWISILPNGHVVLRALGDTGYMDPAHISSR